MRRRLASYTANMGQESVFLAQRFQLLLAVLHSARHLDGRAGIPDTQPIHSFYRANYAYRAVQNQISSDIVVDLDEFRQLASDTNTATRRQASPPCSMPSARRFWAQPMPSDMLNAIMPAMLATNDANTRARNAVYLVAVSPQYQVQR